VVRKLHLGYSPSASSGTALVHVLVQLVCCGVHRLSQHSAIRASLLHACRTTTACSCKQRAVRQCLSQKAACTTKVTAVSSGHCYCMCVKQLQLDLAASTHLGMRLLDRKPSLAASIHP
jgi:hypothetical protein